MDLNYIDIGKRIRKLRKEQKITQEQLAEKAELSIVHISHIETANTKLSLPALVSIANILDVSIDSLLCDSMVGKSADNIFRSEIEETVKDCTDTELRIIADMVHALKDSLRRRQK